MYHTHLLPMSNTFHILLLFPSMENCYLHQPETVVVTSPLPPLPLLPLLPLHPLLPLLPLHPLNPLLPLHHLHHLFDVAAVHYLSTGAPPFSTSISFFFLLPLFLRRINSNQNFPSDHYSFVFLSLLLACDTCIYIKKKRVTKDDRKIQYIYI